MLEYERIMKSQGAVPSIPAQRPAGWAEGVAPGVGLDLNAVQANQALTITSKHTISCTQSSVGGLVRLTPFPVIVKNRVKTL